MSLKPEICSIYKSSKKDEMYIYVRKSDALSRVPSALLAMFGAPKLFGTLLITSDKNWHEQRRNKFWVILLKRAFIYKCRLRVKIICWTCIVLMKANISKSNSGEQLR